MAQVTVTVNGKPLKEYVEKERTSEIEEFYASEMRGFRRACYRPITTKNNVQVTKARAGENNSVKYVN